MWKELKPFVPVLFLASALTVGAIVLTNVLDSRSEHLAGYRFEAGVGNRRVGSTGHGTSATVSGPGFAAVQRARPVRHTSMTFERDNAEEVLTDGLTELSFLDTPVAIGSGGFEYDLTFRIPKWGERTPDPSSTHDKVLANTVFTSGKLGKLIILDMDLQSCGQAVQGAPATPPVNIPYDTGGVSFCLGEIVDQDSGPFSSFPVGDRQRGCTVGDVVTIPYDGTDYKGQVVATQVLSLATTEDVTGTPPNAGAPGITQTIIDFHQRCDRVIIALEGKTGQDLEDLFDSLGNLDALTVSHVKHEAIAPPTIYVDGAEGTTGFEPTITAVDMNDNFSIHVLTKGVDYIWDPVAGVVYIDRSRLPASDLRLHFRGHVYDTRKTLFAEDICNLNEGFDGMLEGVISIGTGVDVSVSCWLGFYNGVDPFEDHIDIIPEGDVPPTLFDWDFPTDSGVFIHGSQSKYDVGDLQWRVAPLNSYRIGSIPVNISYPQLVHMQTWYEFPIWFFPVVPRVDKEGVEIKKCVVDMSFESGTMTHFKLDYEYPGPGVFSQDITDDEVEIKLLVVWYSEAGGIITLEKADDSLSIVHSFRKITIGETDYLRGTPDVTACARAAKATHKPGKILAIIPIPAEAVPESFTLAEVDSVTELVYASCSQYNGGNYVDGFPRSLHIESWLLQFDSMEVGQMHFQIDKDELVETDYWAEDGGIADSPALDWTAP